MKLHRNGKKKADIQREYDLTPSLVDSWIYQADNSEYFKESDNRTLEEIELIIFRKKIKQQEMEIDILK